MKTSFYYQYVQNLKLLITHLSMVHNFTLSLQIGRNEQWIFKQKLAGNSRIEISKQETLVFNQSQKDRFLDMLYFFLCRLPTKTPIIVSLFSIDGKPQLTDQPLDFSFSSLITILQTHFSNHRPKMIFLNRA